MLYLLGGFLLVMLAPAAIVATTAMLRTLPAKEKPKALPAATSAGPKVPGKLMCYCGHGKWEHLPFSKSCQVSKCRCFKFTPME